MGIISNCFGFNFHGKNTISGIVLFAQSTCFPLNPNTSCVFVCLEIILVYFDNCGAHWYWAATACQHELQPTIEPPLPLFSKGAVRKKGNLKGCQKCWNYLDIFALLHTGWYLRLIYPNQGSFLLDIISNRTKRETNLRLKIVKQRIFCFHKSALRPHIWGWML